VHALSSRQRTKSIPRLLRRCPTPAVRPDPVADLRHVLAVFADVVRPLGFSGQVALPILRAALNLPGI
jgi:hypothetical protein